MKAQSLGPLFRVRSSWSVEYLAAPSAAAAIAMYEQLLSEQKEVEDASVYPVIAVDLVTDDVWTTTPRRQLRAV